MLRRELRRLWGSAREHSLWLTVGVYMGIAVTGWLFYLRGSVSLEGVILYTVLTPLLISSVYLLRKSRQQRNIGRLVLVGGGGAALGFPIWLSVNYVLYGAPWAPLRGYDGPLAPISFILGAVLSYGGAAYVMDRLGKRRDYKPFM